MKEEYQDQDNNEKYHYLIGIGIHGIRSNTPGKRYKDCFASWKESDVEKAIKMSNNKMWETNLDQALSAFDIPHHCIEPMMKRAIVQDLMLVHFTTNYEMTDEEIKIFVEYSDNATLEKYKFKIGGTKNNGC